MDHTINQPPKYTSLLRLARLAGGGVFAGSILLYVLGMIEWFRYAGQHPEKFMPFKWTPADLHMVLGRFGISLETWLTVSLLLSVLATASYCLVGLIIYLRRGRDWFSLYLSLVLVLYGTLTSNQVFILQFIFPGLGFLQYTSVLTWMSWFVVFYLFPNGKFSPVWARWFAGLLIVGFIIDVFFYQGQSPPPWLAALMFIPIILAIFSQAYRWRVSGAVERQQIKWVFLSILLLVSFLAIGTLSVVFPEVTESDQPYAFWIAVFIQFSSLLLIGFPLSIGFAILRYRLWDIDLLIQRTLVYSALTGLLALVYFGAVTLLQSLFTSLSGQQSPAALVLSTLLIAALFSPLRQRIQDFIDRSFYRQKYDAEKALAEFAAAARSETDLEALQSKLAQVAQENLQPVRLNIWLFPANTTRD